MSLFRREHSLPAPAPAAREASYHEIVVHGYGNGTNAVSIAGADEEEKEEEEEEEEVVNLSSPIKTTAGRTLSTSSNSSADSGSHSNGGSDGTAESSAPPTSPLAPPEAPVAVEEPVLARLTTIESKSEYGGVLSRLNTVDSKSEYGTDAISRLVTAEPPNNSGAATPPVPPRGRRREVVSSYLASGLSSFGTQRRSTPSRGGEARRPSSSMGIPARTRAFDYADGYRALVRAEEDEFVREESPSAPRPLRIRAKPALVPLETVRDSLDWDLSLATDLDGVLIDREVRDEWEHYTGLGGHTPVERVAVHA